MKEVYATLKEIEEIVDWWYSLNKGYTDLNNLDDVLRRFTGLFYYLTEESAKAYQDYTISYVRRRVGLSKQEQALIESSGLSKAKAESKSISLCEELYNTEATNESYHYTLKIKLNAMSKIIEAIKQKISNLKLEKQNTNNQV